MNAVQHILIFGVRIYQRTLSPALAALTGPLGHCRFEPSCSQYALEAVQKHGAIKGCVLAAWRLARCGPWGACGADPVPEQFHILKKAQGHSCAGVDRMEAIPRGRG